MLLHNRQQYEIMRLHKLCFVRVIRFKPVQTANRKQSFTRVTPYYLISTANFYHIAR